MVAPKSLPRSFSCEDYTSPVNLSNPNRVYRIQSISIPKWQFEIEIAASAEVTPWKPHACTQEWSRHLSPHRGKSIKELFLSLLGSKNNVLRQTGSPNKVLSLLGQWQTIELQGGLSNYSALNIDTACGTKCGKARSRVYEYPSERPTPNRHPIYRTTMITSKTAQLRKASGWSDIDCPIGLLENYIDEVDICEHMQLT